VNLLRGDFNITLLVRWRPMREQAFRGWSRAHPNLQRRMKRRACGDTPCSA